MFKKILISIILLFLPPLSIAETDLVAPVKQTMNDFLTKNNIPGALVQIYRSGKPITLYLGNAQATTQYDMSWLGEIFTGLLLAQQVDAAKMQLASPVKQFFSASELASRGWTENGGDFDKITLRSLATHTSGLPANATMNYLTNTNQANIVDGTWQSSSIGTTMLIKALENVTHKNIDDLYQRQIFSVLGMQSVKATGTELKMSVADIQKFLGAAIGLPGTPEKILYPMRLTQTAFVELQDRMLGLGWQINMHEDTSKEEADNSVLEVPVRPVFKTDHLYEKDSSKAFIAVLPNKKSGIVILLNQPSNPEELGNIGRQLLIELSK